jgi:hypothetical protein
MGLLLWLAKQQAKRTLRKAKDAVGDAAQSVTRPLGR